MAGTRTTVKEIARLAGVSIGTVDRVLHGREGVSIETRRRVEGIIESSGFRPNILARQLSLGKTYLFRALLPRADQDSGYWGVCRRGIELAAKHLAAYGARVVVEEFDRYDRGAYARLIGDGDGADGLLLAPVMPELLRAALGGGRLPYAFFDGVAPGCSPLFSIKQDAFAAGAAAARMLDLLAPGAGPLAVIDPYPEERHIGLRVEGFRAYFAAPSAGARPAGERRAIELACPLFEDPATSGPFLASLFEREPELAGILVANASGHVAAEWLARLGMKARCALVTWDLVSANAAALRSGALDCVISQRPFAQARDAMERLFRAVVHGGEEGAPVGAPIDAPIEIYLKENMPSVGEGGWEGR
jgi:LacI family transcriptional regulator